ncbi:hypothetical protein IEZ26_10700 [Nocardioides cavernae]|uniref:Sensor domain-containing protein n=1 Tax=Nocardioides cavernae TaxID=1921566 RepID=A0ABR8NAD7_9ACTN|nr:hypothetical protein [Nocardioides cavernae]MBD3925091.1 hypothetical protein [Nocardioides cavernae]MBM7514533.1 hypothetical protein [Nocardioides cavernae]
MRHRARLVTAALACTLALAAGCGDQSADGPTTGGSSDGSVASASDGTSPGTAIPDDFPLSSGMGGPADTVPTSRSGTGLRDLELCGTSPLRGLGTRDRMVADNSGGESADTRELLVLGAPDDARRLADRLAGLVADCAEPDASRDMETRTEVLASPFGPGPATTLLQTYSFDGEPGTGATIVHVVPVGAALLVTSTYGQWTRERARDAVDATVGPLRGTVEALAMFGEVPTSTPAPTETPTETPTEAPTTPSPSAPSSSPPSSTPSAPPTSTPTTDPTGTPETPQPTEPAEIPADFPLGVGLPEDGGDNDVTPPTDDVGMDPVEMCGRDVWPDADAASTRHLYSFVLGPEYYDGRELVVHADADAAVEAMTEVRRAARDCRRSANQVWTVLPRDTGYDTVTMGLTYADGLGSSVFQVTRVGSARLMVQTYGEGSLASLDRQADEVTGTTNQIVQSMCAFTKTGC